MQDIIDFIREDMRSEQPSQNPEELLARAHAKLGQPRVDEFFATPVTFGDLFRIATAVMKEDKK